MGDAITAMRNRAKEQFNEAAINRAVAPIGERVKGAGHEAVAEAGDKLSGAYREALGSVNHVNFANDRFISKLTELEGMAQGLSPDLQRRFTRALNETVMRKMSPNGSILGADLKAVDSEIGQIAARYSKSSVASEQELGDALKQLQAIFKQEVGEAVPDVAARLKAADTGWANLVRVEGAAKSAKNHDGVFTPAQFNSSVQRSDRSVRGRSVSRGSALGQDLGTAAQNVLGNKYPDSGTMGRAGILTGLIHPALPLSMAAGAGVYTPQVQNLLRYLLTQRPDQAPAVANYLRKLVGPAALLGAPAMAQESH